MKNEIRIQCKSLCKPVVFLDRNGGYGGLIEVFVKSNCQSVRLHSTEIIAINLSFEGDGTQLSNCLHR